MTRLLGSRASRPARARPAWWSIARRDLLEHVRSLRFLSLCFLSCSLLPLAAVTNARAFRIELATTDALRAGMQRAQANGVPKFASMSPISQTHENMTDEGLRAVRAPTPLSVLAVGYDRSQPSYWQFEPSGVVPGPPLVQPEGMAGLTGEIDFVFVTQVVLGLLALLLSFDAISGEKEGGTLRLMLSYPVPRVQVVAGKYVGGILTLALPVGLGSSLALLALQLAGAGLARSEEWLRVGFAALAAIVYLAGMFGLGLAVSAATHRARTALVVLLLAWVLCVLVLPRVATLVASTARPADSDDVVRRREAAALLPLERERERALASAYAGIAGGAGADLALSPVDRQRYEQARETVEADFFRRRRDVSRQIEDAREREVDGQQRLARSMSRLSPSALLGAFAMNVLGTGESLREGWRRQTRAHQRQLELEIFDKVYGMEVIALDDRGAIRGSSWSSPQLDDPALPHYSAHRFDYAPPSLRATLWESLPDLAILVLYALLGFVGAATLFLRYDPR